MKVEKFGSIIVHLRNDGNSSGCGEIRGLFSRQLYGPKVQLCFPISTNAMLPAGNIRIFMWWNGSRPSTTLQNSAGKSPTSLSFPCGSVSGIALLTGATGINGRKLGVDNDPIACLSLRMNSRRTNCVTRVITNDCQLWLTSGSPASSGINSC